MRRSTRLGLIAVVTLLALAGAYTVYWRIVAGQIEDGVVAWQHAEKTHEIAASWRSLRVTGYPFAFRVEVVDAAFRDRAWSPAPELRLARLVGRARPWDFDDWRLAAPDGLSADLAGVGGRLPLQLAAQSGEGAVSVRAQGAGWIWLNLQRIAIASATRLPIKSADVWVSLPQKPATKDTDPTLGIAVDLRGMEVPAPPASFGNSIEELALGLTLKGAVPAGSMAQAAAAWRDGGGTIEVDNLRLQWGGLGVSANGTLSLDRQLQPIAAFSSGIEGFSEILKALVAADQLTPEQASLIEIALNMLAKPGPDGKPQLTAPFTIQNGKMYLGPARLGVVPRIAWE